MKHKLLVFISSVVFIVLAFCQHAFAVSKIERFVIEHPVGLFFLIIGPVVGALFIYWIVLYIFHFGKAGRDIVKEKKERLKIDEQKHELFTKIPEGSVEQALSLPSARLIARSQHGFLEEHKLHSDKEFFIGRSDTCDIRIKEPRASRLHAKIRPEKEGYILYDLVSKGGTRVNAVKIKRHRLRHNDRIGIGYTEIIFKLEV
ncbi:FHA domain-containing protein [bacterium]|nr:FHA domain-containing protein [bacterium]